MTTPDDRSPRPADPDPLPRTNAVDAPAVESETLETETLETGTRAERPVRRAGDIAVERTGTAERTSGTRSTETGRTESGRTESGRTESGRTESGRANTQRTGRTDAGRGGRAGTATTSPAEAPLEDPTKGGSRTAGIWIALILGAIVLILLLVFIIQNPTRTSFTYFGADFSLPLGVAMLLAAIAGALVMALVGSVRMIQMALGLRKLRKQVAQIRKATER